MLTNTLLNQDCVIALIEHADKDGLTHETAPLILVKNQLEESG